MSRYLLGFLYPISRLISYSVFEKEQKIIEGLYMMGLQDGVFHLSWFHTSWVQHQQIRSYQVNHIMLTVRISFIPSLLTAAVPTPPDIWCQTVARFLISWIIWLAVIVASIVQVREEGWTGGMRESGSTDKKEK